MSEVHAARFSYRLIPLFIVLLAASYFLSPVLPVSVGWENGPIENLQAVLLFIGGIWALQRRRASTNSRQRNFWLIITPIWFAMSARELSWGAVFCTPIKFSAQTGPSFSAAQQLWYRPAVAPALLVVLIACIWSFIKTKQTQTVTELWKRHSIPLIEIGIFVLCMFISAVAEGHMGMSFSHFSDGAAEIFEEFAELWGYISLLFAQWRVIRGLPP
jgi:hypothetical protein